MRVRLEIAFLSGLMACSSADGASTDSDSGVHSPTTQTDAGSKGISVAVTPIIAHLAPHATTQFSAQITGSSDNAVAWSVQEGAAGGTISAAGLYTAPATAGSYHVIAKSHADASATGTASAAVSTPGECTKLPPAGTWDNISPVGTSAGTSIAVDPFNPSIVWLAAGNGNMTAGLFKSTDCAATWTHTNTGRNSSIIDSSSDWSIAIDFVTPGVMYLVGGYGGLNLWKTTNGGVDWDPLFTADSDYGKATHQSRADLFVNNVSMDPTNPLHLVIDTHGGSVEAETFDGGKTWKITTTPLPWGENGGVMLLNATSWLWGGGETPDGLYLTTDNGTSWNKVGSFAANGEGANEPITKLSDGAYYLATLSGMIRSTDALTWTQVSQDRVVGFASGDGRMYASDQWTPSFHTAKISDPTKWSAVPAPNGFPAGQGCPYLDYDSAHHLLYASCFAGGVWRLVTQ